MSSKPKKLKHHRVHPRPQPIEPDAYYAAPQLAARWGVHPITVWGWSRTGRIPKPTKLGPNTSRWSGQAIIEHEAALAEASRG